MPERPAPARPADARVSIGNAQLDGMLEGGLVAHRPYLVVGPSGTGKTTLALQFLCEGVRRGERSLLVTLEEPPNEIRLNHRNLLPDLDRVEVFDAIPDVMRYEHAPFKDIASVRQIVPFEKVGPEIRKTAELNSVEVTITALEQMLRSEIVRRAYTRIAIDSLTALQYFCMKGFDPIGGAQTFLRFVSDLRATTVLTVESPLEDVDTPERMLARGEVRLFRWELDGVTVRAVGVEKFRGSAHDVRLHPYRIGNRGLDVNLGVTISRDTRQILEPVPVVVAPAPPPAAARSLSDEVSDLMALGVDVAPLRDEVEAALAAVRGGHADAAGPHLTRASSLTIALADSVVAAGPPSANGDRPPSDAYRRIAARAESVRVGVPPTRFPDPKELEPQLEQVLSLLPLPPGRATVGESPPATSGGSPDVPPPRASAPTLPARPAPVAPPSLPTTAPPPIPERPGTGTGAGGPPVEGGVPPTDRQGSAVGPALVHSRVRAIPEPPAAPKGGTASPAATPSSGVTVVPSVTAPMTEESPPPLPNTSSPPLPTEGPGGPERATAGSPGAVAAPKRRRKTSGAPRRKAVATPAVEAAPPVSSATAPPRKRAVRKRKAPPVVTASPEPIVPPAEVAPAPVPVPPSRPPEGAE